MEIPTFVKWAGGKKQLLKQFESLYPKNFNNYFEPFVGSGAVFFYMRKRDLAKTAMYSEPERKYSLSDVNPDLVDLYIHIRDNVRELIPLLEEHKRKNDQDTNYYYEVRDAFNKPSKGLGRSAQLLYLNKTCFNGLYRVNSKGEFNVPKGSYKNPAIVNKKILVEASRLLQGVKIQCIGFEKIASQIRKKDFVYLDPPYFPLNGTASFTSYTKQDFTAEDQKRLAAYYRKLDKKGCFLMLSNSDTDFINDLYEGYKIRKVTATRMINCQADKRGRINEIVVTNY